MRGAGCGWCESRELSEELREGVGRAETASCACGFVVGECICEAGESEDELPERACALSSDVAELDVGIAGGFVDCGLLGPAPGVSGDSKRWDFSSSK